MGKVGEQMINLSTLERNKPHYKLWQNIIFTVKKLWVWDKPILFYIFGKIPIILLLPLCGIYLPKIIVSEIENGMGPLHLVGSVGFIAVIMLILSVLQQFIQAKMELHTTKVSHKMETIVSTKAMDTNYEVIDRPSTQVLIKKAYDLASGYTSGGIQEFPVLFATILANALGFTVYTGILATLNPLIILLIIASTFISYFVNTAVNGWVFRNRAHWLRLDLKLAYLTYKSGSFDTAKDIRLYNMKNWFCDAFYKFMNKRIKWTIFMQLFYFIGHVVEALLILLRDGLAYVYLIYLVFNGSISVSDFVLYFGVISGFSSWCMEIIKNLAKINELNFNICDFREYLELPEYIKDESKIKVSDMAGKPCKIELNHVSYRYEGESEDTLKDLNLVIKPGEKIAVVGHNGAGKTTFVKLICGLYKPTSGSIKVNNHAISEYDQENYYNLFSPVFQDIRLLPISIEKNITLCESEEIDRPRLMHCLKLSGFDKVIEKLPNGLDTLLIRDMNEQAIQLSGGEEQKLMLTRALYKDAPIMILDEPTAALDPIAENAMYLKYNELTAYKTSIFISHRLASTRFCDRIILIEHGKIIEVGSHEELLNLGKKYAEMFEIQAQYYKNSEEGGQDDCISF